MAGKVILIGAVHESLHALRSVVNHPRADLVCVVTLSSQAASKVSGVADLAGEAARHGVDLLRVDDVNSPEAVHQIGRYAPDLLAVVGWTRLIGDDLLAVPARGCIGFHASLLPKHRGRAPVNWSIIKGETETGNTMMMLNAGVDTGDIVDQLATPIYLDDTCETVYERVAELGGQMLFSHMDALLDGTANLRAQTDYGSDVLPKRVPDMGVIDWDRPPVDVHNWVRALTHPYPGAFSTFRGRKVMVWGSRPPMRSSHGGDPGEILDVTDEGVRVAVRRGSIVLTRLAEVGQPDVSSTTWARKLEIRSGERFDQPDSALASWAKGEGPRPTVRVATGTRV